MNIQIDCKDNVTETNSAEIYKDDGRYYLNIEYCIKKSDGNEYTIRIPKMRIPIEELSNILMKNYELWDCRNMRRNMLRKVSCMCVAEYPAMNLEIETSGKDKRFYTICKKK